MRKIQKTEGKLHPIRKAAVEKLVEELRALGGNMVIAHDDLSVPLPPLCLVNVKEQFRVEGRSDIGPVAIDCTYTLSGRTVIIVVARWSVKYQLNTLPYVKVAPPQIGFASVWSENEYDEGGTVDSVNFEFSSENYVRKRLFKIKDAAGYAELRRLVMEMCERLRSGI